MSYVHSILLPLLPKRWRTRITITRDGCWEWSGWNSGDGYGKTRVKGKCKMAHRAIYEFVHGPIGDGLVLDHLCRHRACCNPEHVEVVTQKENTVRGEVVLYREKGFENGKE